MGVIVTGHNSPNGFQNSEAVTVSNLNSHVNDSSFNTTAVDDSSIELTNNNQQLQLKNSSSTTTGTTLNKLQYIGTGKVLGRASASDGNVEQLSIDTNLSSVSVTDNELASSKAIKAYVDSNRPQIVVDETSAFQQFTAAENAFTDVPNLLVTITPKRANSTLLIEADLQVGINNNNMACGKFMRSIGGAAYSDFKLPAGGGSRQSAHFSICAYTDRQGIIHPLYHSITDTPTYNLGDSITYKIRLAGVQTNVIFNMNGSYVNTDDSDHLHALSQLRVTEI